MHIIAYASLLLALLLSIGASGLALLQLGQHRQEMLGLIRNCNWLVSFALLLSSALLLHALFWEDYSLEYVASYTDRLLPVFYRLTAFWAGQPGSMLFWTLCCTLACSLFTACRSLKGQSAQTELWYWIFYYANIAFFCLILTSWSNPFIALEPAPADGQGLNPLLQNPGMIFHPPLLFIGYAGFLVPGCLALAQLLADPGRLDWFRLTRPFIIFSWCLLTAGIVLGAWWAYMELGWGGYWAWDPVENASLLPWLVATACLHLLAIQNANAKLGRFTALLMFMTFIAAVFGTYLTRSGVIQSVHAFGDGGVGTPLLVYVVISFILCLAIAVFAHVKSAPLSSPASREGALVFTSWIFLALCLIILLATIWPVLSAMTGGRAMGLEASFYNRVCLPIATVLLLLLAICTWFGWHGFLAGPGATRRFYASCGAFIASLAALWATGYREILPLVAASAAIAALCAMGMHLADRALWQSRRAFSSWGAHVGLALLAIGVAFSGAYTVDREIYLARGQQENVGPYTVLLDGISDSSEPAYDYLQATLKITQGDKLIGILKPERRIYAKFGAMQFSEVDVISSVAEDIYASLLGMDEDYRVLLKISIGPLVNWIWIGGAIMCLLPLGGIWRRRKAQQN